MTFSIALAGPFTGIRSEYGNMIRSVAEKYQDRLDLHFYDDEADYHKATELASKIVGNEHDVVVGHFNSRCAIAASVLYKKHSIPLLLPASTSDAISHLDLVYRFCAKDHDILSAITDKVVIDKSIEYRIWDDGTDYGLYLKKELVKNCDDLIPEINIGKDSNVRVICLGSQSNISNFIQTYGKRFKYLVSDDCDIQVFYDSCRHIKDILIARSSVGYLGLLTEALDFLVKCESENINNKRDLIELIDKSKRFDVNGDATFVEFGIYKVS